MSGDPPIGAIQPCVDENESSDRGERTRPPKLAGEKNHCISAAEDSPVVGEHAHFFERLFRSETESFVNPFALERFEIESALCERLLEVEGEITAKAAIFIEEDPAAEGNRFRSFCYFCQLRNHWINFFKPPLQFPEV